jgi:hypothetical protein
MKIKFSHKYHKLLVPGATAEYIETAILLDVVPINLEDVSKAFLDYDTDAGLFELPKSGIYMMLIFCKERSWDLFTTLRRWTPDKQTYYRSGIGKIFDIEIKS